MSHALINEVPNDIPEGLGERDDDVHDLQFGDIDDLDEDSSHVSQDHVVPGNELAADPIKEILERQAEAIEKLAVGIQDISHALRQIAVALTPQNLRRAAVVENAEVPKE